jgi:hypothetical protein
MTRASATGQQQVTRDFSSLAGPVIYARTGMLPAGARPWPRQGAPTTLVCDAIVSVEFAFRRAR